MILSRQKQTKTTYAEGDITALQWHTAASPGTFQTALIVVPPF